MFDPSIHRVFVIREGNKDNIFEIWHILREVGDNKVKEKVENNEQQKHGKESNDVDIINNQSPIRNGEMLSENIYEISGMHS